MYLALLNFAVKEKILRDCQYVLEFAQDKSTKKSVDIKITKKQPKRKTI